MKKTLIALAAVAATGAAFAQSSVTLSGKLGFAYQQNLANEQGLSVTDGDLVVTASEDLGGGLKATASAAFVNRGRQTAVTGRDATVSLAGGFGTVTIGNVEAANGIIGRGFAGAPVSMPTGFDGAVLSGPKNADILTYTSPSMSGLTFGLSTLDSIGSAVGSSSGEGALQANVLAVNYAAGPISAGLDLTKFAGTSTASRTRASISYDAGMAVLGFGYEKTSGADAQTALGVKVPMGAITGGLVYAKNGDLNGWGIGADYALSKRTVVNASYGRVNDAAVTAGSYATNKQYRIRVLHSF